MVAGEDFVTLAVKVIPLLTNVFLSVMEEELYFCCRFISFIYFYYFPDAGEQVEKQRCKAPSLSLPSLFLFCSLSPFIPLPLLPVYFTFPPLLFARLLFSSFFAFLFLSCILLFFTVIFYLFFFSFLKILKNRYH